MSDAREFIRPESRPVLRSLKPWQRQVIVLKHSDGGIILEIKPENIHVLLSPTQAREFSVCILRGLGHVVNERQLEAE
jgi:hypothetical protein